MSIDKSWTTLDRLSKEFWSGLSAFIERCKDHVTQSGLCRCPCERCENLEYLSLEDIKVHIHIHGFSQSYKIWKFHGEPVVLPKPLEHAIPQTTNQLHEEGRQFVDYRCSEKFQKHSLTNKGCQKNLAQVRYDNRGVSPIELYRRMRVRNGDFIETQAVQNYAHMIQMRDDPHNTLTEDEIIQEVLGEHRGWTRRVGQKLPQYAFAADSSSSSSRRYAKEEVQRMIAEYTAPLWRKLNMTPPPFNAKDDGDDDDDDDDDGGGGGDDDDDDDDDE